MVTLITEKLQDQTLEEVLTTDTVRFFSTKPLLVFCRPHRRDEIVKIFILHMSFLIILIQISRTDSGRTTEKKLKRQIKYW
jgi:hypothetical protein